MAKTLVLVRHAKSLHDVYVMADVERHLAPRGYEDSEKTANWVVHAGLLPDLIISSTAIRAYSTALIVANGCGYPSGKIQLNDGVYEAQVENLLYLVCSLPNKANTVFLFGHNPGFTDLVNLFCGAVLSHLPTAAAAVLSMHETQWENAGPGKASLQEVYSSHKEIG
jgi:phosphohistidine phosphatase